MSIVSKSGEEPKIGKSRRWASERKSVATFENRLSPYVETLLGILDYNEHLRSRSLRMLMAESRLLGKLIYTVSVVLDCAGASNPIFEKAARRVLEVVWQFRTHEEVFVRRALLLLVAATIRNCPAWVLFEACLQEVNELVAWLQTTAEEDVDDEVRMLCAAALYQLSSAQKLNPQYTLTEQHTDSF